MRLLQRLRSPEDALMSHKMHPFRDSMRLLGQNLVKGEAVMGLGRLISSGSFERD